MESLTPRQKEVVFQTFMKQRTRQQIAERLNTSDLNVRDILTRAIANMKMILTNNSGEGYMDTVVFTLLWMTVPTFVIGWHISSWLYPKLKQAGSARRHIIFPNLVGTWVRWSDYEIRNISNKPYLIPTECAVELPYSYADQTSELMTDALNLGKQLYYDDFCDSYYDSIFLDDARERQKITRYEQACVDFARKYGLFGSSIACSQFCALRTASPSLILCNPSRSAKTAARSTTTPTRKASFAA